MQKYQLREAIVAVSHDPDGHTKLITLAAGTVLTVKNAVSAAGLVDAESQGQAISVFIQDLQARAELADTTSGSSHRR